MTAAVSPRGSGSAQSTPTGLTESDAFHAQAEFCRVMGHIVRLEILHILHESGGPVASQDLLERLGVAKACLSQHLSRMASVGLIRSHREGRRLFVQIAHPEIGVACDLVRKVLMRQARAAYSTLSDD
jgi:ArsR family transcriptional regulator